MTPAADPREPEEPPIRFTDNRKIKRDAAAAAAATTDAADETTSSAAAAAEPPGDPVTEQEEVPMVQASLLDERTADLQRLQAEYANYRKRTDRDRLLAGDAAVARVLTELLPVVDDLERAKAHDDLTGPLKAVADKLDSVTAKLGLTSFGVVGDPFDPSRHEAVLHDESAEVTVPTCTTVMRPGYAVGDKLLRPAMVGVSDPSSTATEDHGESQGAATSEPTAENEPADPPPNPPNDKPEGDQPPVS